ncbi:MAG: response regulator [Lachnospiraceae bacterium]|nr:response regulator [Lachnospiraceae bacterium]
MTKILIAHDSALVRKAICDIISESTNTYEIITCCDGEEAVSKVVSEKPDIIIVNMYLPRKNGSEVINTLTSKKIRFKAILLHGEAKEDIDAASVFSGMKEVKCVSVPFHIFGSGHKKFKADLSEVARFLINSSSSGLFGNESLVSSQEKIVPKPSPRAESVFSKVNSTSASVTSGNSKRIIAIASSTGGPQALHVMIKMLPPLGVPVVIVQHMPKGFTFSLAERIDSESKLKVKEADDGEELKPDIVYLAPGGRHLEVYTRNGKGYARVFDDPPVNSLRPCADVMFNSLAKTHYDDIVCVVLTGMGRDGTDGIQFLKKHKHVRVITQSQETCVVYGMPKAADQSGITDVSAPIDKVADAIRKELEVK